MAILITGVAGFIGSKLAKLFLAEGKRVYGVDNYVLGCEANIADILDNPLFEFEVLDAAKDSNLFDFAQKVHELEAIDIIWHMAANSDIPAGITDAQVDLANTFMTTFKVLETVKKLGIGKLTFASSSAVYGELKEVLTENTGPLFPISNYGAMKLASEALISAALESYLERVWIYRFPNVVGVPATHGVILDFVHKLQATPETLEVLGNGTQQKTYLHVDELIDAMLFIQQNAKQRLNFFNVGAQDKGVRVSAIAEETVKRVSPGAQIVYGKSDRGWVGDVPKFEYSVEKLTQLGWQPKNSSLNAIRKAIDEIASQEGS